MPVYSWCYAGNYTSRTKIREASRQINVFLLIEFKFIEILLIQLFKAQRRNYREQFSERKNKLQYIKAGLMFKSYVTLAIRGANSNMQIGCAFFK